MTKVDEGHESSSSDSTGALTVDPETTESQPVPKEHSEVGEVLADRYRLEEHINDDPAGRQVWRGTDVILRRPVAMVLRHPGGDAALEMLQAAVTASRVVHPNLAGVYDAVDEGDRAYVVREWVEGQSLRQILLESPLEPRRAALVTHAIADACAAVHETGVAHGNVHPGTVLIGDEGRVVLADARVTDATSQEADVRAIGAVLYSALTGHWPHEIEGSKALPNALRVDGGKIASPRQIRAGVPADLDELCMLLLHPEGESPTAAEVAADLSRFGPAPLDSLLGPDTPVRLPRATPAAMHTRRMRIRWALAVAGFVIVALTASLVAVTWPSGDKATDQTAPGTSSPRPGPSTAPSPLVLTAGQVRIVAPAGDRDDELTGADRALDGKLDTGWQTQQYWDHPEFGRIKPGMGLLINLGKSYNVSSVEVQFDRPGATVELKAGTEDPGNNSQGDGKILSSYTTVEGPVDNISNRKLFTGKDGVQYLLVWITKLPPVSEGRYQVGIQEVTVRVQ
ncbi:protein kinase [Longispora sp. NPDC051575]|uniref:protein kinase family protein n=1 Tax=Longispora sp. NPDC051575 TaxID=3154943 RepID=UPI003449D413